MTDVGRKHLMRRLSAATSLSDLSDVWARFGVDAQADDEVRAHRLRCERRLMK